jgi:hypothetical protein
MEQLNLFRLEPLDTKIKLTAAGRVYEQVNVMSRFDQRPEWTEERWHPAGRFPVKENIRQP